MSRQAIRPSHMTVVNLVSTAVDSISEIAKISAKTAANYCASNFNVTTSGLLF
jgi:hypothetical protein